MSEPDGNVLDSSGKPLKTQELAEGVGFEPTVRLPVRLISSQVPLTTQPPFQPSKLQALTSIPFQSCFLTAPNRLQSCNCYRVAKQDRENVKNTCQRMASGVRFRKCRICSNTLSVGTILERSKSTAESFARANLSKVSPPADKLAPPTKPAAPNRTRAQDPSFGVAIGGLLSRS